MTRILFAVTALALLAGCTGPAQSGPNDAAGTTSTPASAGAVNPETGANNGAAGR